MLFDFGHAKAKQAARDKRKSFLFSTVNKSFTKLVIIYCLGFLNGCNVWLFYRRLFQRQNRSKLNSFGIITSTLKKKQQQSVHLMLSNLAIC